MRARPSGFMFCVLAGIGAIVAAVLFVLGRQIPDEWNSIIMVGRMVATGAIIGLAASAVWSARLYSALERAPGVSGGNAVVSVSGDPRMRSNGYLYEGRVSSRRSGRSIRMMVSSEVLLDDRIGYRCAGRFEPLRDDDYSRSLFLKGHAGSFRVLSVTGEAREEGFSPILILRAKMLDSLAPSQSDARALVSGVVCGRTTELSGSDAERVFSETGLTHLVAVSGSHLACIAGFVGAMLDRRGSAAGRRATVLIGAVCAYVAFTGFAPSAIRSAIMVACSLAAKLLGRRPHGLSGLSLAVSAMLFFDPGVAHDLGFQLSASSVLFISLFGSYLSELLVRLRLPAMLADALAMTLAAQWATLPLTVPVFKSLSLVSPLANVVIGPLMTLLMGSGFVLAPLASLSSAVAWLVAPLEWLARLAIFLADAMSRVPFASVLIDVSAAAWFILYALAAVVYVLWPDPNPRPVILIALAVSIGCFVHVVRWTRFAPCSVTIMDVGQGDAILLRDGSSAVLVDAGVDEATRTALARNSVYGLDALVVSHWDRDHWGGVTSFASDIPIGSVIVADGAAGSAPSEFEAAVSAPVIELGHGDAFRCGSIKCRVVWPSAEVAGEENSDSLCLLAEFDCESGPIRMLLTGDAEHRELREFADEVGDIDILKLGHHGSAASVDSPSLDTLDPEVSVASAGAGNSYGHPTGECIEYVESSGSEFLCTIDRGDIRIAPDANGFSIRTQRR